MSDRELIKKLASIVVKQQKIQNKILQKLGIDTGSADDALKALILNSSSNWLLNKSLSGEPSFRIESTTADPESTTLSYNAHVTLKVNNEDAKLAAENATDGLLPKLRADFKAASTKPPLNGCTVEFTLTTLVGKVGPVGQVK